jgi:hypothetical protein
MSGAISEEGRKSIAGLARRLQEFYDESMEIGNPQLLPGQESLFNSSIAAQRLATTEQVAEHLEAQIAWLDFHLQTYASCSLSSLLEQTSNSSGAVLDEELDDLVEKAVHATRAAITAEIRRALIEMSDEFKARVNSLEQDLKMGKFSSDREGFSRKIDLTETDTQKALIFLQSALGSYGYQGGSFTHFKNIVVRLPRILNANEVQMLFRECGAPESLAEDLLNGLKELSGIRKSLQRRGLGPTSR